MDCFREHLERMIHAQLRVEGVEPSPPTEIIFQRNGHCVELILRFGNFSSRALALDTFPYELDAAERILAAHPNSRAVMRRQVLREAQSIWSRVYEGLQVRSQTDAIRAAIRLGVEAGASPSLLMDLQHRLQETEEHVRRHHRNPIYTYNTYTQEIAPLPDPEPDRRQQMQRMLEAIRLVGARIDSAMDRLGVRELGIEGSWEAEDKGRALLKENLTQAQLSQYDTEGYFDVVGGSSGHTYRIYQGRQMNIAQLNSTGERVCGWCFLPEGGLVTGDVMLAQKTALECCEEQALKVANRF